MSGLSLCVWLAVLMVALLLNISSVNSASKRMQREVRSSSNLKLKRENHKLLRLNNLQVKTVTGLSNMKQFRRRELRPLLRERVAGTPGNLAVQKSIKRWMKKRLGWDISEDTFIGDTPLGRKRFTNIIATLDPSAKRFLTFVCHFDSKYFEEFTFIGATDSAVPCAMMIDLARTLRNFLRASKGAEAEDVSLRFLFLDGEEAFKEWTATDSIYGARHLAEKWENSAHPHDNRSSVLDSIDAFILLDLIGAQNPTFINYFPDATGELFNRLRLIEASLHQQQELEQHRSINQYFSSRRAGSGIQDDHIPFLSRGVPILHLISNPFPSVWHIEDDNESALHYPTIDNLNKILRIFVAEYLHLDV